MDQFSFYQLLKKNKKGNDWEGNLMICDRIIQYNEASKFVNIMKRVSFVP